MYDPDLVKPMREELTSLGASELLTPADVEKAVGKPGTTLIFVNSVCGCAAGGARPGLRLSLMKGQKRPTQIVTVFAGMETAAVERAREFFKPYRPSSPQIALMKDGKLVKMIQRQDIEGKQPQQIADTLTAAFNEFC
jgi:putative YphP/YqiW family bacilliredoxin